MLPPARPIRGSLHELGAFVVREADNRTLQSLRRLDHEAPVVRGRLQDLTLGRVEMAEDLDPELVSDEAVRLAFEETVRSCLQGVLEDAHGCCRAQHVAKRCAVGRRCLHGLFDGREDDALTAELEEGSMSAFRVGRPSQQCDGGLLADQRHQSLARPVPIDEEHESRTQMGQVGRERVSVGCFEPTHRQVMRSQADIAVSMLGPRPVDVEPIEHALEERLPSKMDIGIRNSGDQPLYPDDEHVGFGQSDVILDEETPGSPCRRRSKTRMIELQCCGSMKPRHERNDELPVVIVDPIDRRAIKSLRRDLGLEPIERPVTIHHQQMQRVADRRVS